MNLGFMQKWPKYMGKWAGQPTYFPHKIWEHLFNIVEFKDYVACTTDHLLRFGNHWDMPVDSVAPKLHTMREDPFDRWHAGKLIHFAINNQTKNYFRFAPVIPCISTQTVKIEEKVMTTYDCVKLKDGRVFCVKIDGKYLPSYRIREMAINDGFEDVEHFFTWFNKSETYKLIHWTNLRY